ncbi:hypothetical protein H1D32_14260 [Anaerobacillus sp. CMMVII]|uniref:hypothetical protein n=1 Tax=Anaerobacillus sp. CMMVII TaxID=2755588 RepID=UPI0021B7980F|nr:hypothetical protein [Anaerobacillus sp. CMMVII]MCT8138778.1 hypothetical protein [Anaerobacillus sp. CMMVII]
MVEEKLEIRGISRKELIIYLLQLGAIESDNHLYRANNWTCYISDEDRFHMFQSWIPRVELVFSSTDLDSLKEVLKNFRKKTFRAGG